MKYLRYAESDANGLLSSQQKTGIACSRQRVDSQGGREEDGSDSNDEGKTAQNTEGEASKGGARPHRGVEVPRYHKPETLGYNEFY